MPEWTTAQKTAIQLRDHLILVSAAAGSGKTAVLTERVIRRILDTNSDISLNDLLIVTFTRSAAAELKSKIAKAIEKELGKEELSASAREKLQNELLRLGGAQISTIDSFYLQIVRAHFERLGLPANFRLADENELRVLSEEILDDLIPEFYKKYEENNVAENGEGPFDKIQNNLFADCIDHFFDGTSTSNINDIFIRFYASFGRVKGGIDALRQSAAQLRAEAELPFLQTHPGAAFLSRFDAVIFSYLQVLKDMTEQYLAVPENEQKMGGVIANEKFHCETVARALREKNWESLQKALSAFEFTDLSRVGGKPRWPDFYKNARNAFKSALQNTYRPLVDSIFPAEQKKVFLKTAELAEMLYRFYTAFQERYRAEKITRGMQDFNDVRDAVYQIVTDPENNSLLETIRGQYKEIYIDEYQDVDEIQDEIFAKIGGKNRFMVGDIKQSIYGFRGSDPSVFAGYRSAMPLAGTPEAENAGSVCVFMSDNFRCDKPIIDFTNAVCSFLFSASPNSVHYLPQDDLKHAKLPPEGTPVVSSPVCIRVFEKPEGKKESEETTAEASRDEVIWVADEIQRLLKSGRKNDGSKIEPSDIAILSRKKEPLSEFQKELETRGIPIANVSGNSISQSPLFMELLNLLRVIDNPYRDLPLSEHLLSDLGGFSLDELQTLRTDFSTEKSLFDALTLSAQAEGKLAKKAAVFIQWLDFYRSIAAVQSADRFLRILYQDQKLQPYAFTPEFLTVYEQARVYQQSAWTGLYGFLNYLTRLKQADQLESSGFRKAESAVNAMTIHASKGLEYPVVFLVDCGRSIQSSVSKPRLVYRKEVGFASYLYSRENELSKASFLKTIADFSAKDAELEEEIRLLYVAMTRAREKLYLTATPTRKTEKFRLDASMIRRNDRNSILSAKSYIDWVCGVLEKMPEERKKVDLQSISCTDRQSDQPASEKAENVVVPPAAMNDPIALHYRNVLEKASSFVYPLDALQGIPTKAAASKLNADLLDILKNGDEESSIAERISLMRSEQPEFQSLLAIREQPTAAEIGTATHAFLADCNFADLSKNGIKAELDRLAEQKFLSEDTAKIVNLRAVKRFAESELMQKIQAAKAVYREQQFSLFVPLEELTKNPDLAASLKGRELFVQGSIDLLLVGQDGKIELYDYKTDHITEEERKNPALLCEHMKARHGNQLEYYARAVEQLFGKRPDRISIFSLSLGKIIELF